MRTPTGGLYLRIRHEGANVAGMLEDRVATATTHDYGFVREQVRAERVPPSALVLWSVNCASASQRGGRSADDVTPGTSRLEIGGVSHCLRESESGERADRRIFGRPWRRSSGTWV
jgi:hypothetical protein